MRRGGAGSTGGRIDVTGYNVALTDAARVDASGAAGGGVVRFGGGSAGQDPTIRNANATWMAPSASIHADALVNGNGGNIAAFSEGASRIHGTLSAKGGAQGGNGGLIETSGHALDTTGATIDASAAKGQGGRWLLDPFEESSSCRCCRKAPPGRPTAKPDPAIPIPVMFGPLTAGTYILNTAITDPLNHGMTVTVSTGLDLDDNAGDINVNAPIVTTGTLPATLKLSASGSVLVTSNITSSSGPLSIVFDANVGGTSPASLVSLQGITLSTNGGSVTLGGGGTSPVLIDTSSVNTANGNLTVTGTFPVNGVAIGYLTTSSARASSSTLRPLPLKAARSH